MSLVERVSNYLAKWLASNVPNTKYPTVEDQIEVFTYGWMLPIGALHKGFLLICFTIILGILVGNILNSIISILSIILTFSSLRIIAAGGYHMSTYNGCIIVSFTQFIGSALIVLLTLCYWTQSSIWFLFVICLIISLYISIRYCPRDTPNNRIIDVLQIKKLKRQSLYFLLIWSVLMIALIFFNLKIIVISSCFGLLLELFSVCKIGQIVYSKLDS